jgi:hypothetical protein
MIAAHLPSPGLRGRPARWRGRTTGNEPVPRNIETTSVCMRVESYLHANGVMASSVKGVYTRVQVPQLRGGTLAGPVLANFASLGTYKLQYISKLNK